MNSRERPQSGRHRWRLPRFARVGREKVLRRAWPNLSVRALRHLGQKMMILKPNGGLSFSHARVQHSHRLLPEFPREWWSATNAHPSAHPFNLTPRRDVLSRRDLGAARNGPSSSQVQSGSIRDSGQGCRVCLVLGGAGSRSRAVAWCAVTNLFARS